MNRDLELLNFINKNAVMGRDSVDHMIPLAEDPAFRELLESMHEDYNRVCISSETLMSAGGENPEGVSSIARTMSGAMIDFSTIGDRSSAKFASMLLEGTRRGITELSEKMRIYSGAKEEYMNLAHAFHHILENNERELHSFI